MLSLVDEKINAYMERLISVSDPVLKEMEALAEKEDFPIVGPQVGKFLFLITQLKQPEVVFEMGSGFGYSAWWFAKASASKTKIHWTDRDDENLRLAKDFLTRSGIDQKIVFHQADAIESLRFYKGQVDILFVDMDKSSYPAAYELFKEKSRSGSLLIADNMLWSGKVIKKISDPDTLGIQKFTKLVFEDKNLISTILPIRDGVLFSRRK